MSIIMSAIRIVFAADCNFAFSRLGAQDGSGLLAQDAFPRFLSEKRRNGLYSNRGYAPCSSKISRT